MIQIPDGIKNLMRSDNCTKNYRIVGDGFEITNNNIVEGSVSFTESVCSGKTLQFGAGERSVFEFQTFGVDNAIDGEISVYIEILCNSSISGSVYKSDINSYVYSIPLGIFSVESNKKKDGSSNFRSIVAYGKQDEINPNDRVYRHIESALKNGIEYKVHPEALAQCFIRSTSNLNEYSTSNAMTYSSITRKISMPEAVAYYSDNGRYVKIPSKDIEFKNTSTVEFTIEASRTEYYEVGCFLEEIDPTGELGIIICNLYLDDVLVENAWARKVCFIASNNAKIRIELNKIVEDFKIKLYYSQGIDLSTSIYLITKSITATFRTEEPEHQDGDICFLHNKPNADAVVMRSPEIVTWNACYHNDDIFNQGLSLEDWNAFMYEISELYEDLNNNGSICDQLFEPYDMTGIFDRFRLSQARKTISYTPSGDIVNNGWHIFLKDICNYATFSNAS